MALPRPALDALSSNGHTAVAAPGLGTAGRFAVIGHPDLPGGPTIRSIELRDAGKTIGRALWSNSADRHGCVQLLRIEVTEAHRRRGHGVAIFRELQRIAADDLRLHGHRLRRISCEVRQKSEVVARAFLTRLGFHHVTTVKHFLRGEDLLIYMLGCD